MNNQTYEMMETLFRRAAGTTSNVFWIIHDYDGTSSAPTVSSAFFQPYASVPNFAKRVITIGTDPLLITGWSAFIALAMAIKLFDTIGNLIAWDLDKAKTDISEAGAAMFIFILHILAAIASPVINIIDLVGGGITTLTCNEPIEEEQNEHSLTQTP